MSNKSFKEKRDHPKGFLNSPLILNESVRGVDFWNEKSLDNRSEILSGRLLQIFQKYNLSEDNLDLYRKPRNKVESTEYTIEHFEMSDDISLCFEVINQRILNLDATVVREAKKLYIAYKSDTNFVDIVPQKKRLWLTLNMDISQVDDPDGLCIDVTDMGKWGNGNVRLSVSCESDIEYAMSIIKQSLALQLDNS